MFGGFEDVPPLLRALAERGSPVRERPQKLDGLRDVPAQSQTTQQASGVYNFASVFSIRRCNSSFMAFTSAAVAGLPIWLCSSYGSFCIS